VGGEVAEPERAILGVGGEDAGGGRGQLGQGGNPLGTAAEPVTPEELLYPRRRQTHATVGQVADQLAGAQGGTGDRLGQHRLDLLRWGRIRHHRWPAALGQQRRQPSALGPAGPVVVAGARAPEGAAGLGHAGLRGPVQDLDTAVVDDLCWGHGGGLLRLFGRNQRVHHQPTNGGICNLIP
jgi:hypothetical protein